MIVLLCLFAFIHLSESSSVGIGCTNQFQVIKSCGTSSTCANGYRFYPIGICNKKSATASIVLSCSADGGLLTAVVYQSSTDCTGASITANYDVSNGADDGLTSEYLTCACTSSPYWSRVRFWSDLSCSTAAGISDNWYLSTTPEQETSPPGCTSIYPGTCSSDGTISTASYEHSDTTCPVDTTSSGYVYSNNAITLGCEGANDYIGIGSAYQVIDVMPQDSSACPSGSSCPSTNICNTAAPTAAPTPAPTEFPTSARQATTEAITFGVSQSLSGLSKADWDSNVADNLAVFKAATAQLLGCAESDIDNMVVADSSRRRLIQFHEAETSRALSTNSITITYDVVLQVASGESSSDVYSTAVNAIVDSTASGCSTDCLATIIADVAEANGMTSADIVSATVTAVLSSNVGSAMIITIPAPTAAPTAVPSDDDTWMTTEVIAGLVCVVFIVVLSCCVALYKMNLSKKIDEEHDDHAQENNSFTKIDGKPDGYAQENKPLVISDTNQEDP